MIHGLAWLHAFGTRYDLLVVRPVEYNPDACPVRFFDQSQSVRIAIRHKNANRKRPLLTLRHWNQRLRMDIDCLLWLHRPPMQLAPPQQRRGTRISSALCSRLTLQSSHRSKSSVPHRLGSSA